LTGTVTISDNRALQAIAFAQADPLCAVCKGGGWVESQKGDRPCNCAYRRVFRRCLRRYQEDVGGSNCGRPTMTVTARGALVRGFPTVEYRADFELLAWRTLDPWHQELFVRHFLQGQEWTRCIGPLRTDRGQFWHAVFRVERLMGRAAVEMEPYPLYPFGAYFGGRQITVQNITKTGKIGVSYGAVAA
jgi:hypothetical protein